MYRQRLRGAQFHHTDQLIALYTSGGLSWNNQIDCFQEWLDIARRYGPPEAAECFFRPLIQSAIRTAARERSTANRGTALLVTAESVLRRVVGRWEPPRRFAVRVHARLERVMRAFHVPTASRRVRQSHLLLERRYLEKYPEERAAHYSEGGATQASRLRVVGVFPAPTTEVDLLFDELASMPERVDLAVLYATRRSLSAEPRHTHWVIRGFHIRRADRAGGRRYPINWAIWRALFRLKPQCIVVYGWSTFAARSAIVWCRLRGVPYILVMEPSGVNLHARPKRPVTETAVAWTAKGAAGALVDGSAEYESMLARGTRPDHIGVRADRADGRHEQRAGNLMTSFRWPSVRQT